MTHKNWWHTEGSGIRPLPNEDIEEFAKRITEIAWSNGEFVEREACAKYVEGLMVGNQPLTVVMGAIGDGIRARGEIK